MVASRMHHAHQALEAGDKEKALLWVNMALALDETFVTGLRMKEQLTGRRAEIPSVVVCDNPRLPSSLKTRSCAIFLSSATRARTCSSAIENEGQRHCL